MKRYIITIVALLATFSSSVAQTRIKASDIIKQVNEGKPVEYNNVEIEGALDFTDLQNRTSKRSAEDWFDRNETWESNVEASVKFTNCTFLDDVIAYYHVDRRNTTFIAHFEKDAIFTNCTFRHASEFKYSEFNGVAKFDGCTFNDVANFKYAEFSSGPTFSNVKFESDADFKYAEFPRETSFEKATFYALANFKYAKFKTPLNINGKAFKGGEDFKYTKVDGRSFTSYLLNNR